jgi:hypothetical protein
MKLDGTDRLCMALYGRLSEAEDYLGGSDAKMLHDAADRITQLQTQLDSLRARAAWRKEIEEL